MKLLSYFIDNLLFFISPRRTKRAFVKKNLLENLQLMLRLNPYAQTLKKQQAVMQMRQQRKKNRDTEQDKKRS